MFENLHSKVHSMKYDIKINPGYFDTLKMCFNQ